MAGPGICILCLAGTCASLMHPVFNHVAPFGYLFHTVYLLMADIGNPDLFVCVVVRSGFVSTSPVIMRFSASRPAGLHGRFVQKTVDNTIIKQVTFTKFLGIIIDDKLKWIQHISYIKNKTSKGIGIILKARKF